MSIPNGFRSYEQFRREVMRPQNRGLSSAVEDLAEEIYHFVHDEEFDHLWDSSDDEE